MSGAVRAAAGRWATISALIALSSGLAWAGTASVGGSAQPAPSVTNPLLNQQYNVTLPLTNTSFSTPDLKPIAVDIIPSLPAPPPELSIRLATTTGGTDIPDLVGFIPQNANGCVSNAACVTGCVGDSNGTCNLGTNKCNNAAGVNCTTDADCQLKGRVVITTDGTCKMPANSTPQNLATIKVQQLAVVPLFVMRGRATYLGSVGTCSSGTCTNAPTQTCSINGDCDFSDNSADATGSANLTPVFCGNAKKDQASETCDTGIISQIPTPAQCPTCPAGITNTCRAPGDPGQCTICGDGIVQASLEFCDDGNTTNEPNGTPSQCRNDCTACGDGVLQTSFGENCDGNNFLPGLDPGANTCRPNSAGVGEACTYCGDGVKQADEGCDFNAAPNTPDNPSPGGCSATCVTITTTTSTSTSTSTSSTSSTSTSTSSSSSTSTSTSSSSSTSTSTSTSSSSSTSTSSSSTSTSTTTSTFVTTTIPGRHYQCYEINPFTFQRRTTTLVDRYGSSTLMLRGPNRLCAPADKNGEDPQAPQVEEHLTGFPTLASTPIARITGQTIKNQFGTVKLDLVRRKSLLVPTSKSLTQPPAPPADPFSNQFQCYLVQRSRGTPLFTKILNVTATDQFGTRTLDILKPKLFCTPVVNDNQNPGALARTDSLLCYRARYRTWRPLTDPFINNQYVAKKVHLDEFTEFCVPSLLLAN